MATELNFMRSLWKHDLSLGPAPETVSFAVAQADIFTLIEMCEQLRAWQARAMPIVEAVATLEEHGDGWDAWCFDFEELTPPEKHQDDCPIVLARALLAEVSAILPTPQR